MNATVDRDISVVIPTRNRADKLAQCLAALSKQTLPANRFEVLIVDNGSHEGAFAQAQREAAAMLCRAEVLSEQTPGPAAARNRAIEKSRAGRLLFIGDDILAAPELLTRHVEAAKPHGDRAILGFTDWAPGLRVTPFMRYLAPDRGAQFRYGTIEDPLDCTYHFFYTSNISIDRRWFDLEMFDERYPYACLEDADLGYRLERHGHKIVYHKPALAWHNHSVRFGEFIDRMRQMGESRVLFYRKYPELHTDHDAIPSEGYRALDTRKRRLKIGALAKTIAVGDRLGIPFSEKTYFHVLEHHYVRAFFASLDRGDFAEVEPHT